MSLTFKEILELIERVAESGIAGVEIEQGGTKVRIEGKAAHPKVFAYTGEVNPELSSIPMAALPAAPPVESPKAEAKSVPAGTHVMTSPIVGTFYRSPGPEAPVFVNVGDRVQKGRVLCIIEAMKLMNEIESDADGIIAEIHPQNGQPVEFGEPLFGIRV